MKNWQATLRFFCGVSGFVLLIFSIVDNWWFDIMEFKLPDPNDGSNTIIAHIHGGLFQVCYPGYGTHENESYFLTGFEVCSPLTDMMPSPLTKSMTITNGLILASLVASSIMTVYSVIIDPKCESHVIGEGYALCFGMNMAGAAMSCTVAVASGILVCNCLDELSRAAWINVGGTNLLLICSLLTATKCSIKRPMNLHYFYMTIEALSISLLPFVGFLYSFDSQEYAHNPIATSILNSLKRCEKRYDLWNFCTGYCLSKDGSFDSWSCDRWSEYPDGQITWSFNTPFGILVSQIMFFVVLTTSLWTLLSMYFRRDNFRLNILTTGICYLVLGLTMYCYNLMESTSPVPGKFESEFPMNANNNGMAIYVVIIQFIIHLFLYVFDTIYIYSSEETLSQKIKIAESTKL